MRKVVYLLPLVLLIPPSALLSVSSGVAIQHRAAVTPNAATPTPFPLPTQVAPLFPTQTLIITGEGNMIGPDGEIQAIEPQYFELHELDTRTDHFRFYSVEGYLPIDLASLALEVEALFDYVSARLETTTDPTIGIMFVPPDTRSCPFRGSAPSPSDGTGMAIITIYADNQTSFEQILGVLAHETAHVLQGAADKHHWMSHHVTLSEGLATWAAGTYYYRWQGSWSFEALVRSYLDQATYLPLYDNYDLSVAYRGGGCLERRDILYTEWAAFIDFLLETYGMNRLEALFGSSPPEETEIDGEAVVIHRPADFEDVYGSALNQLEALWLSQLQSSNSYPLE